jgi:hypothetical protein
MPNIRNGVLTMPSHGFVILPLGSWSTKPPSGVQCNTAPRCMASSKRAAAGAQWGLVTGSMYAKLVFVIGIDVGTHDTWGWCGELLHQPRFSLRPQARRQV